MRVAFSRGPRSAPYRVGALLALAIATACGGEATENRSGNAAEPNEPDVPDEPEAPAPGNLRFRVHNDGMKPVYILTSGYACLAVELRTCDNIVECDPFEGCNDFDECDLLNTEYVDSPCEGAAYGCDEMAQGTFSRVEPGDSVIVSIARDPSWNAGTYYARLGFASELCGEDLCEIPGFDFSGSTVADALCDSNVLGDPVLTTQFDLPDTPVSEDVEIDVEL